MDNGLVGALLIGFVGWMLIGAVLGMLVDGCTLLEERREAAVRIERVKTVK